MSYLLIRFGGLSNNLFLRGRLEQATLPIKAMKAY